MHLLLSTLRINLQLILGLWVTIHQFFNPCCKPYRSHVLLSIFIFFCPLIQLNNLPYFNVCCTLAKCPFDLYSQNFLITLSTIGTEFHSFFILSFTSCHQKCYSMITLITVWNGSLSIIGKPTQFSMSKARTRTGLQDWTETQWVWATHIWASLSRNYRALKGREESGLSLNGISYLPNPLPLCCFTDIYL